MAVVWIGALAFSASALATSATLLKDISPGIDTSHPYGLTDLGGTLLFVADDGTHGYELWKVLP